MTKSIIRIGSALLAATSVIAAPIAQDGSDPSNVCQVVSETVNFDVTPASSLLQFPYFTVTPPAASAPFSTLDSTPYTKIAVSTPASDTNPNLKGSFSVAGDFEVTLHSITMAASQSQVDSAPHHMGAVQAKIECLGSDWNDVRGSKYWWFNASLKKVVFDAEDADKKAFAKCKIIRTSMLSGDGNWSLFAIGEVVVSKAC